MSQAAGALASYSPQFYEEQQGGSRRSAGSVVHLLLDLVAPRSVVDVGCGVGTWLAAFKDAGVSDILGIDGPHVDTEHLHIPADAFLAHDLCAPLFLSRTFDLAISLEVAEHLPERHAEAFVSSLVRLAPVVLFSAAIPMQGGTHHVNEQWPTYWAQLFAQHGYVAVDAIRPAVWNDNAIEWWYAQNALLFCQANRLGDYPSLLEAARSTGPGPLPLVHPRNYLENRCLMDYYLARAPIRQLFRALCAALKRRLLLPGQSLISS